MNRFILFPLFLIFVSPFSNASEIICQAEVISEDKAVTNTVSLGIGNDIFYYTEVNFEGLLWKFRYVTRSQGLSIDIENNKNRRLVLSTHNSTFHVHQQAIVHSAIEGRFITVLCKHEPGH